MGDISELRTLITVVTFLGVLVLLIAWVPSQFFTVGDIRTVETPNFEGIDIQFFANTANIQINESGGFYYPLDPNWYIVQVDDGDGNFGGYDVQIWYRINGSYPYSTRHEHLGHWFIFTFAHNLVYYDKSGIDMGTDLTVEEIQENVDDSGETSQFTMKCAHFQARVIYNYNSTKWNSFSQAWDNQELYVFHGIDFDQTYTGYSAFDLISRLLFFQLPEMNIYVNALIAIPLWIAIAYVTVILIYRTIGAVFGGGA